MSRVWFFTAGLLAPFSFLIAPAQAAPTYSALALGTLGGASSLASGLNAFGQTAGQVDLPGSGYAAFVTSAGLSLTPADTLAGLLGGQNSVADAINDGGDIAGYFMDNGSPLAFAASGDAIDVLGTFGGSQSVAFGISASGVVVGGAENAAEQSQAFVHAGGGTLNAATDDLGTLGGASSTAEAINSAGTVAGEAQTAAGDDHAFADPGAAALTAADDMGTLGGANSDAYAVSASGLVAGMSETGMVDAGGNAIFHGFLDDGAGMIDLGTLGGAFVDSVALGINDAGVVVGNSEEGASAGPNDEAAIVDFGSGMMNLNGLVMPGALGGDTLISANAINNKGQIVADGYDSAQGTYQAFLLTPQAAAVPEAAPEWLLLSAAPLLLALRRRAAL